MKRDGSVMLYGYIACLAAEAKRDFSVVEKREIEVEIHRLIFLGFALLSFSFILHPASSLPSSIPQSFNPSILTNTLLVSRPLSTSTYSIVSMPFRMRTVRVSSSCCTRTLSRPMR